MKRGSKVINIVYNSGQVGFPVLLATVLLSTTGTYDAEAAAADVRAALLAFGIDLATQVTCFMGDNVTFNDCIAAALGLARGKCLPHALALIIKHGVKLLVAADKSVDMMTLTVTAGGILRAGGTTKRIAELRETYELDGNKMRVYTNRFGSAVNVNAYLLANFEKVAAFYTSSSTLPTVEEDEAEDDDDSEDDGITAAAKPGKAAVRVAKMYTKPTDRWSKVAMTIMDRMFGGIAAMIPQLSAEAEHVPINIVEQLGLQREYLASYILTPKILTDEVLQTVFVDDATPAQLATGFAKFGAAVKAAAAAAAAAYDKHVVSACELLERRWRFDPRKLPEEHADGVYDKPFFGVLPHKYGVKLVTQYRVYVHEWKAMTTADKDCYKGIKMHAYWMAKQSIWPDLAAVALWWSEYPMSGIASERVFGIMRAMELPSRFSMSDESFKRELMFRANSAVLETLLVAAVAKM